MLPDVRLLLIVVYSVSYKEEESVTVYSDVVSGTGDIVKRG